jgi:CheY-like chemotaxis protein
MLRILMLEDSNADGELIRYELRKAHVTFSFRRVNTEQAFVKELGEFSPHLILSDYELPGFDGLTALTLAKDINPSLPLIMVSGSLDDRIRAECMKAGADDYVMKDNLRRIGPAVQQALARSRAVAELSA